MHGLLADASPTDLRRLSDGTRWTNEQLLYHMVFGYLIVRVLLPLVRGVSRLPAPVGEAFAATLDAGTRPFDVVNFWGAVGGAKVFDHRRMASLLDRVVAALHRRLETETEAGLQRGMAFPPRWNPFFKDRMSVLDVYHFATQHFDFHARQLTLDPGTAN
ncbi:DinB family protein [Amycolatopsis sp. NPDC049252]|uniref:DinB family protein n=1 Tax=Amycolatopsis sp. NPDC049252 TaxID=3363933 RepID=UPI003715C30A